MQITQAKRDILGFGQGTARFVEYNNSNYESSPPPKGCFVCAAPAVIVALLRGMKIYILHICVTSCIAKRNEEQEWFEKEQLIERARPFSEEEFNEGNNIIINISF